MPIKSITRRTLAALHRLRSGWLSTPTARINAVRGVLKEIGSFIPKGARNVIPAVSLLIEDADSGLPDVLRAHLNDAVTEIRRLETKVKDIERQLEALSKQMPDVQRLRTIPGVGLLTATALVGFVCDHKRFPTGRRFASFLGLVPKENSSGDSRRLGRIIKRGDSYLRMLLTHGARSVLRAAAIAKTPNDRLRTWGVNVQKRRGHNKAAIAVANKLARTAWALSKHETHYVPVLHAAQ